jgi:hypothetical protein
MKLKVGIKLRLGFGTIRGPLMVSALPFDFKPKDMSKDPTGCETETQAAARYSK